MNYHTLSSEIREYSKYEFLVRYCLFISSLLSALVEFLTFYFPPNFQNLMYLVKYPCNLVS